MKTSVLLCMVLISASATVQASSGTIGFHGGISDPGCDAQLSESAQELRLASCPMSAQGAQISVTSLATGNAAVLLDGKHSVTHVALSDAHPGTDKLSFSNGYAIKNPLQGEYMVIIDYP